jgi:putative ATP-dependent endonuclease of OLD family
MRLDRIKITNHSRLQDLDLEVRGHAVIIGANDVGKSSLLRLLNLLLGASTAQLYQQLSLADLRDEEAELVVEARSIDFSGTERAHFFQAISIDPNTSAESLQVQLLVKRDEDDEAAVTVRRWFPDAGHDRAPSRDQIEAFGWRYLPATRGTSAAAMEGPNSALQSLLRAINLGGERAQLASLLEQFNQQLANSGEITGLRTSVATHLSKAMPRTMTLNDLAVRTSADPAEDVLGNVSMFLERDGEHVPLSEQSDGVRQLMSMTLFDLAEGAANVVAIDEPELHLHPSSQRTVAELFKSSTKSQKILATHSPYIVQRFEPAEVIAVSPAGTCHQLSATQLTQVEKVQANWWSPRLLEVLTARTAIVVEGVSDRIIVEAAAHALDIHLDRLGAVVFEIDGADKFPHVYKFIGKNGFKVPILGLVDDAEKMKWHGAIGGKPTDVFGRFLWASDPDLEAEYCRALTGPVAAKALINAKYCRERNILQSCGASDLDSVDALALADFCRKKDKTGAAVAVAACLDQETASKIASVSGLLDRVRTLGASP